jgi:hypothetical protein
MNKFKKMAIALTIVAAMAGSSMGSQIMCGGNVSLVNTIQGVGVLTLDLGSPGTDINIATFVVNNNSPTFTVTWSFANLANFVSASGTIPMTGLTITEAYANGTNGYHAGTGLARTFTTGTQLGILAVGADPQVTGSAATSVVWTEDQTTATVMDVILMNATWTVGNLVLAGLYTELITFGIVAS